MTIIIISQLATSFIASAGFAILFNAPKRALWQCGTIGMLGWILYYVLFKNGLDTVAATVIAAILVGVLSQISAKTFKIPVIIFNVAGIIPLVPGGLAYNAMRQFVEDDYNLGIQLATKVMLLSGAIALGLVFSEVAKQIGDRYSKRNRARRKRNK